jgi:hypothetical protein
LVRSLKADAEQKDVCVVIAWRQRVTITEPLYKRLLCSHDYILVTPHALTLPCLQALNEHSSPRGENKKLTSGLCLWKTDGKRGFGGFLLTHFQIRLVIRDEIPVQFFASVIVRISR